MPSAVEVILLEHVDNLGQLGDTVSVKPGYARNYLLPQSKALRATKDNIAYFETQKKEIEKKNETKRKDAEKQTKAFENLMVNIIRHASESGQLYGSVSSRDIADAVNEQGKEKIQRNMIDMNQSFKMIGLFPVEVALHPEVKVEITINIARSEEEAKIQAKTGKALVAEDEQQVEAESTISESEQKAEEAAEEAKKKLMEEEALVAEKEKAEEDAEKEAEAEAKSQAKSEARAEKKAAAAEDDEADTETEEGAVEASAESDAEEKAEDDSAEEAKEEKK